MLITCCLSDSQIDIDILAHCNAFVGLIIQVIKVHTCAHLYRTTLNVQLCTNLDNGICWCTYRSLFDLYTVAMRRTR